MPRRPRWAVGPDERAFLVGAVSVDDERGGFMAVGLEESQAS